MDFDDKKLIELFLGLIFVAFLLVASLLIVYNSEDKKVSSYTIQNSYNENTYNSYDKTPDAIDTRPIMDYNRGDYVVHGLEINHEHVRHSNYEEADYSSYGEHKKDETFFNNYRDEFRVYVVNKEKEDMYYKVKFYFCDYEENCFSETMQRYIHAGEEGNFVYVDIHDKKNKYHDWEYKVFPEN